MAGIGLNRSRQAPAENTPSFGAIAERFRRAGDLDRAIALCQEGLKKFPNQLSARVTLGWSLLDKGEYEQARQELERVIRRAPDNLAAIRGLAELHDRAEHTVTGLGPDGVWTAPDEEADQPPGTAAAAASAIVGEDEAEASPISATGEPPWAEPALPVPVPAQELDPQTLIETPAQAAVAHAATPGASIFEEVAERPESTPVSEAAPVEPVATVPAPIARAEMAPPVEAPAAVEPPALLDGTLTGEATADLLDDASNWGSFEQPEPAAELDPAPVLFAETAEDDLARMARELAADPTEPAADVVIDLPAETGLEHEFESFEASAVDPVPSDAVELIAADAALDPELPMVFDQADEAGQVADTMEVVRLEAEPVDLEPPHVRDAKSWAGLTLVEPLSREEPEFQLEPVAEDDGASDAAADDQATELLEEGLDEAPAAAALDAGAVVELPFSDPEPEAAAEEAASIEEAVAEEAEAAELPPEVDVPAVAAMADAAAEPEPVVASPVLAALVADDFPDAEDLPAETGEAVVEEQHAAPPVFSPEPHWSPAALEPAGPATHSAPPEVAAPRHQPSRDEDAATMPVAAASSLGEEPGELARPPRRAVSEPAPVAALEGFLRKISARRLHLTPGSVA